MGSCMSESPAVSLPNSGQNARIPYQWIMVVFALGLFGAIFYEGIARMVHDWFDGEEYSHCVLLPFISAYLIWKARDRLQPVQWRGHWAGVLLVTVGLLLNLVGKYSSVFALQQYALLLTLYGVVISLGGGFLFRKLLAPLLLLVLM